MPMYPNPNSVIAMLTIGRAFTTSSMYQSIVNATTRIATSGKASIPSLYAMPTIDTHPRSPITVAGW